MTPITSEREHMALAARPATEIAIATAPIERSAFYLESEGQPLFAWLHTTPTTRMLDHGIIVCAPVGHEQLHAHRGLRHLADALAGLDAPVLRFDWHGTGDSAGTDSDPARVKTWKANLRDAIRWMRGQLGCRRISLVGLRVGATLAASFSSDEELENLVLWAPITKGRAYAREMLAIDLTGELRPKPKNANPKDVEAAGFLLTEESTAELSQINLLKDPLKCQRAFIVSQAELPDDRQLSERFTTLGIPVEQLATEGLPGMLTEPHRGTVPHEAIRKIADWLAVSISQPGTAEHQSISDDASLAGADLQLQPGRAILGPSKIELEYWRELPRNFSSLCTIREQPLHIAREPQLFGILSEPVSIDERLPTVVLLNAGASYHTGPGRLHVHMAREFAARGFHCLRVDLSGLGDSIAPPSAEENDSYAETAFRDIQLTLRCLRDQFAAKRCVLIGLCSGAYAAFQAAAQFDDSMLVESVLINPLTFFWKTGMSLDAAPIHEVLKTNYYLNMIRRPDKWWKLLSGQSETGWLKAGRLLWSLVKKRKVQKQTERRTEITERGRGPSRSEPGHPECDDLPGDLERIANTKRHLAMYFSKTDPGYRLLTSRAANAVKQLQKSGQLELTFFDDADHTFSRRVTRTALIDVIVSDLLRRYQS